MKKAIAALLAMTLLLTCGCAVQAVKESEEDCFHLYYASDLTASTGGDAITSVAIDWQKLPTENSQAQAEAILELLLGACGEENFISPIPSGTKLQSCEIRGTVAWVDFSAAYGQLSGIQLTIADYCVALNLTQIEGIHAVRITVSGQELDYRDSNLFLAGDVLLSSTEDVVRTLAATLYFPDENGALTMEERLISIYEGKSRLGTVMDALLAGPENEDLQQLLPEGFTTTSVWVEENTCFLNLPAEDVQILPQERAKQQQIVQGIVNSLCSVEDIEAVQILIDNAVADSFGMVDISQPLTAR